MTAAKTSGTGKGSKTNADEPEGISRSGPHPTEVKRENDEPASTPVNDVARSGVVIVPARGHVRAGTAELVAVLAEYSGFEMREYVYNRADMSDVVAAMFDEGCGVVVNGLDGVDPQLCAGVLVMNYDYPGLFLPHERHVDVPAAVPKYLPPYSVKLEERCETRSDGYREVTIHVVSGPDMEAERLLLRNRVLPMLVERCRTRRVRPVYVDLRDDAAGCGPGLAVRTAEVAREGAVHVVLLSGKFEAEMRGNERLRRFIEKIPKGGLQAKFDWMRFAPEDYSRTEYVLAQVLHLAEEPGWMSTAGGGSRRLITASGTSGGLGAGSGLARMSGGSGLGLGKSSGAGGVGAASGARAPRSSVFGSIFGTGAGKSTGGGGVGGRQLSRRSGGSSTKSFFSLKSSGGSGDGDDDGDLTHEEQAAVEAAEAAAAAAADSKSQRHAAAMRQIAVLSHQHVLVYTRDAEFASQLPEHEVQEFYSLDGYERERVGSMLSALYAHPQVAIRPYRADFAPPTHPRGGGGFVGGVPGHATALDDFVADVLEDIWSRISHEFPADPVKDAVMWHEREPEFTLQRSLPFYFSRSVQEHTVVRCIKLGRPKVIFVGSGPGMGVTSVMQRCARECRRLYGNLDGAARDEVVVLSAFSGVGRPHFTPTQITRLLAQSIKAHCLHPHDIPGTYNGARAALLSMIRATVNINRRVAIFVDAVTAADNPRAVAWLPGEKELPAGVQVVVGGHQLDDRMAQTIAQDRGVLLTPEGVLAYHPQKLSRAQHAALAACAPEAMAHMLLLRPMQHLERKLYVSKHLKLVSVELDDAVLSTLLNKTGLVSITYARHLVERLCTIDTDDVDVGKQIEKFPEDTEAMLSSRLDDLEMMFPRSTLALVLPTLALGCNCLTMEDIMAVMVTTLDEEEEAYLDSIIAPALMWESRHFVTGPFDGTYKISSDVAAKIVLERYAPDEASKRATFRMLAEYYSDLDEDAEDNQSAYAAQDRAGGLHKGGEEDEEARRRQRHSPGRGLLARMHRLSPGALDKDGEGQLVDPEAFQEHHLVIDALHLLPYYLTQARQFGELCALLRDFSFLQAKLELGEGAALLEDFDRVLRTPTPAWVEDLEGGGHKKGTIEYFQCKRNAEKVLRERCVGNHPEAFQAWMGDRFTGDPDSALGDMVAYRNLLWRNLATLHRRPHLVLQAAMNAPGDAEPGAAAEDAVRQLAPPPRGAAARTPGAYCFADAAPGEEFFLLWGNRPEEAPVMETCEGEVHAEAVVSVAWLDAAGFATGGEEGVVGLWSSVTGECAARLTGHSHAVTCLLHVDVLKQGRRLVSGSRDHSVRVWKLEGHMGRSSQTLLGHADHVTALGYAQPTGELITAGCDRRFIVWDLTQPAAKQVRRVDTTHIGPITSLAISPEGSSFVTGSADKTVQVWSMTPTRKKTAQQQRAEAAAAAAGKAPKAAEDNLGGPELALKLQGHLSDVTCCCFGPSAASLATGSLDHSIMLWNPVAGAHVGILVGHTASVTDVSYNADGRFLLSTSRDYHLRIWHPRSGQTVLVLKQGCVLHSGRFAPDGSQLLVAADEGVCLWSWVGREGSSSMGQMPRRANLFSRGHKLKDEGTRGRGGSDTSPSGGPMRTATALTEETNPLSFEGQAHKGAMTAVAGFSSAPEDEMDDLVETKERRADTHRGSFKAGGGGGGGAPEPVLSGGEDGFVRKISTGRGAGKVTMSFKGHSKVGSASSYIPPPTPSPQ